MLKARLLELQARDVTSKAELNALLNRPADAPLGRALAGPERTFEGAPESLLATALEHRPERKGADAQVERTALQDELMRREYYPDFTLGAEYRALDGADDMAMFMVGLDVPLWAGRNRAGVRQAAREQESGRAAREAVERQIHADVQDAAFRLGTARRTVELYRQELLPQAELRFKASEAGYQTGKADFMDLLESERFLLGARLMLAMAEGDLGMRMARLERALGTGLEGAGK
jgi:outer membrane protein TolC